MNVNCIAINDTERPNEVPTSRWIEKDKEYTIIQLDYMNTQSRILGVKLAEINNDDLFPWTHFRLSRFAINVDDLYQLFNVDEIEEKDLEEQLIEA